jgi:hypothetical protein
MVTGRAADSTSSILLESSDQDEINCLGIEASPSFVRQPEGNGVAERFIRTLKENLLWVRAFKTIEELRAELVAFARRYNETWLVARHGYKTPARIRPRRSQPPYPWPPEQAQSGVSKPYRTTKRSGIQHLLGQKLHQFGVLVLELLQPFGLGDIHAAVLGLPVV